MDFDPIVTSAINRLNKSTTRLTIWIIILNLILVILTGVLVYLTWVLAKK